MNEGEEETTWWHGLLGFLMVAAAAFGLYKLGQALDPGRVAMPKDPGFLELVVADRTVLTILRMAVVVGLAYVVYSVIRLIQSGRFLTGLPGVSVSDAAARAQSAGEEAVNEQEALEQALLEANEDIGFLIDYVQELQEQLQVGDDAADEEGDGDDVVDEEGAGAGTT